MSHFNMITRQYDFYDFLSFAYAFATRGFQTSDLVLCDIYYLTSKAYSSKYDNDFPLVDEDLARLLEKYDHYKRQNTSSVEKLGNGRGDLKEFLEYN